jgi:hypothetical protein
VSPLRPPLLRCALAATVAALLSQPAAGQTAEQYADIDWYGRFAAVEEFAGTFTISFDHAVTSDPNGSDPIFQGRESWSVGGNVLLKQQPDMPNSWKGDGEASMRVDLDVLHGGQAGVVYRESLHAAGRTKLSTPDFPVQVAIVTGGRYWLNFGMPELRGREHWARLDNGETRTATPRVVIFAQPIDIPLPERGQRLRGRQEIPLSDGGRVGMVPQDGSLGWVTPYSREEGRAPKAVVTWDLAPIVHDYRLEVEIPGYTDWFPKAGRDESVPGADLSTRARLLQRDGRPTTVGVVKKYLFELEDVSREPGVAMNWPPPARAKRDPDLRFDRDRNFQYPNWVASDERSVEVRGEVENPEVVLTSYDWGGHGFLRVSAELQDGRTVYGALKAEPGRLRIPIPKRRDGSRIAEHFRARIGQRGDDADDEAQPGRLTPGDGLTVYEEYRGFYEAGQHVRGSLDRKDLFVSVSKELGGAVEPGLGLFESGTGIDVHHRLDEEELGRDRRIDPNQASPGAQRQHGLRMVREATSSPFAAAEVMYVAGTPEARSPRWVDRVRIGLNARPSSLVDGRLVVNPLWATMIAHELGHAVNLRHHGDGDLKGKVWIPERMPDGTEVLTEDGVVIDLQSEAGAHLHFRQQVKDVWVGERAGQHSGDEACFMRYAMASAYRPSPSSDVRYWITGSERPGTRLCSTRTGTGVNQRGRDPRTRYGDAAEGACKDRVRVRDD